MDVPIAANVLGTLGAICWSIQLIPQIVINYRRHNTVGLQRSMMLLWACAGVPLGVYNITNEFNIALRVQPQILTTLSLTTWIQCFHYDNKWKTQTCIAVVVMVGILFGGIEAGLIFALRAGVKDGRHWPVTLMGVLSTALLSAGVLRHYYDIYVHRTVRGISFLFVGIDSAGDVFSLASIFFQSHLDILGIVIYSSEFVLWSGVFACGGYFNLIPWLRQKARQKASQNSSMINNRGDLAPVALESYNMGTSNGIEIGESLQRTPSSRTVFRTPSIVASLHSNES